MVGSRQSVYPPRPAELRSRRRLWLLVQLFRPHSPAARSAPVTSVVDRQAGRTRTCTKADLLDCACLAEYDWSTLGTRSRSSRGTGDLLGFTSGTQAGPTAIVRSVASPDAPPGKHECALWHADDHGAGRQADHRLRAPAPLDAGRAQAEGRADWMSRRELLATWDGPQRTRLDLSPVGRDRPHHQRPTWTTSSTGGATPTPSPPWRRPGSCGPSAPTATTGSASRRAVTGPGPAGHLGHHGDTGNGRS